MRGKKAKFIRRTIETTFGHLAKINYTDKLQRVVDIPIGFKKDESGKILIDDKGQPVLDIFKSLRVTRSVKNDTQRYFYQEAKKKARKI